MLNIRSRGFAQYCNVTANSFAKITNGKNEKPFPICAKTSILDVWKDSKHASEFASEVKDVSFLNQFEYQR